MLKARLAGWMAVLTGVACKCVIAGQWIGQDGRGTSVSWSGLDIVSRFGLDLRGHFDLGVESQPAVP